MPPGIPNVGDVVAGKYRIESVLGVGGMGVVLGARHLRLEERAAIKVLLPELAKREDVVGRFLREARAAFRIRSDHVVRVFDVETLPDGAPYIVMEYLDGRDLGAMTAAEGPLAPERAVDYVLQASEALAEAHGLGIVHRDLKPSNLYATTKPDGSTCIKVLDFGIAKLAGGEFDTSSMTKTNTHMGTPRYMAPEQLRTGLPIDARTDVWALGVVLFELLTNRLPFNGSTLAEIAVAVLLNPTPSMRELRPEIPAELEAVVARCLAKEPSDRYPSVAALTDALAPLASDEGRASAARIARASTIRNPAASASNEAAIAPPSAPVASNTPNRTEIMAPAPAPPLPLPASAPAASPQRRRLVVLGGVVAALLVVVGAGLALFAKPSTSAAEAAADAAPATTVSVIAASGTLAPLAPLAADTGVASATVLRAPPSPQAPPRATHSSSTSTSTSTPRPSHRDQPLPQIH